MKKKKIRIRFGNIFLLLFIIIFIVLIIFCIKEIISWHKDNENINKQVEMITENVEIKEVEDSEQTEIVNPPQETPQEPQDEPQVDPFNPYWDYIQMNLLDVDFSELKKINDSTKGWIQVNGTTINYPFVQALDNDYYLKHSFDKSYNEAGWIFLDYRNNINFLDKNTIIYGHGRLNKTMFGSLKNIINSDWYSNKDNYVIKMSTEAENTLWQVFSVYKIPTTSDYLQIVFRSDEEFVKFVTKLQERSVFDFNTSLSKDDKIITLSTCYNDNEKVVMHAKLIKYEKKNNASQ